MEGEDHIPMVEGSVGPFAYVQSSTSLEGTSQPCLGPLHCRQGLLPFGQLCRYGGG